MDEFTVQPEIQPQTSKKATASFIFLHGSGSTGKTLREYVKDVLGSELTFPDVKIIYPTAPERPFTLKLGDLSTVWFDRAEVSLEAVEDVESVDSSCRLISSLIDKEVESGIPINRIFVGGYSMGACQSLHFAYRFQPQLAGCICLSSFLNNDSAVFKALKTQKHDTLPPLLICHGERDPIVKYKWAEKTFNSLQNLGLTDAKFCNYPTMIHELQKRELEFVKEWIETRVSEK